MPDMTHYERAGDGERYPRKHIPDTVAQKGGNKTECAKRRAILKRYFEERIIEVPCIIKHANEGNCPPWRSDYGFR